MEDILKYLILVVETQLKNPEGICVSDIELALVEARSEYYKLTGYSIEGEK
ncbi:modifier of suppressor tRNAs [Escherichia phage vB_EcoM_ESCO10]|nr:modifier of suppressor tRNAs [Escherichia phage vB_EcoM_ESCO10]